ncbi:L-2,4-diaminobutyrate decarboxylase [Tenacibaculum sp. MAR_2009_124]|uniref:pyridoxal phosphate-dependent decarboxylase family protein n=1 Tax=Tenacibaculum sp. MAR_2009_124 TaxID=1250059 RepID=UPI000895D7E0|nr:pyridoxal-dependent decarboxylase [Tenacibaculum sp. MAR_2009_124]SEB44317.1 L-2,4-diaminobutyrate decarboxylase [Tenacibaculum sp. MAR_2009_124]
MILDEFPVLVDSSLQTDLLHGESFKDLEKQTNVILETLKQFFSKKDFYAGDNLEEINQHKLDAQIDGENTLSFEGALEYLNDLYIKNTIAFHNPNYVAHLNCPVVLPAMAAEIIATTVNTAIETWDQSTSATFIEQAVVRWICNEFKFPESSDGVFTSGGTQSNFMALLMARDHYAFENYGVNIKQHGWFEEVSKFRIFCSEKAHFSVKKNAALLGMGYDSVISVKTDSKMRMDPNELVLAIEKVKQEGNIPVAVVATLGTTDYGSFDPLEIISSIAKEYKMWLHADGAYGGCFVLTDTHKNHFEKIDSVDSITIDFHKTMFQPVCCSAYLAKNKRHFQYVSYYADYLNPLEDKDAQRPNLIEKSIQTTRRFDALKVWFTLKTLGKDTIGKYLERVHHLATSVYNKIKDDIHFEAAHEPELSTIVFRYKALGVQENKVHDRVNMYIKNTLFKQGKTSVASTKLDGNIYLKFTLLNPNNTEENLFEILKMIQQKGEQYKTNN